MEFIQKYFPNLTEHQLVQFQEMEGLYRKWNEEINVISRKDMEHFYERHVLHSLAITRYFEFKDNTRILDVGTGGGFPGIPLAIMFPKVRFHLVDSVGKKTKVVENVAKELGLKNVKVDHVRAESLKNSYDFVVSRAVTKMPKFLGWVQKKINKVHRHTFKNGIIYLKGGDLTEEMSTVKKKYSVLPISDHFEESFFDTKKVVHVEIKNK